MNDRGYGSAGGAAVDIVLIGGPADIPVATRSRRVVSSDRKIKVLHRGGYEHFELLERRDGCDDAGPMIFHWTMRTRIAE